MQLHRDEFDEETAEDVSVGAGQQPLRVLETRELFARLRRPPDTHVQGRAVMPESLLWQVYLELRRRGEERAVGEFLRTLRALLRRRGSGAAELPVHDPDPDEHRCADDPFLGELWKAYKRCLQQSRTGPAGQLLRDIERQIQGN